MEHTTAATAASEVAQKKAPKKFVIERGIPIPGRGIVGGARSTLRQMQVGDSFAVSEDDIGYIRNSIAKIRRDKKMRFSCRKMDGGYRVWCVQEAAA